MKSIDFVGVKLVHYQLTEPESKLHSSVLSSPNSVHEELVNWVVDLDREVLVVVGMNIRNQPVMLHPVSIGDAGRTIASVAEILRVVLMSASTKIMLVHNHPSGDCSPSAADKAFTKRLIKAASLVDVKVVDHVVIGHDSYYSFRESDPDIFGGAYIEN